MENEKVYWLINSKEDERYDTTTWYRCVKIEEFVKRVEVGNEIVGIIFKDNNLGFILKEGKNV